MNIKALIEKKNELMEEARSMLKKAETEVRQLDNTEEVRQAELATKIEELNTQIKEVENRAAVEADSIEKINSQEEKREMENKLTTEVEVRAVEQFLRKQNGEELRAVTAGAGVGALTVPTHLSNLIIEKLYEVAPMFARTRNFTPVNGYLEILREQSFGGGGAVGFVGEMTDMVKGDFSMDKVRLDQKRVGTAIELSQHLINDSGIDVVGYATNLLSRRLGLTLDRNILAGVKATEFEGLNLAVSIENKTTASATAITIDELLGVYTALDPHYIGGAVWVVSRATFNMIAKLKDGNGHYFLVRDVAETGVTYKLFGQAVLINDAMADPQAGARTVLFGNFSEGYATMTKKGLNLQHISGDTTQALRGSHLILLDGYMDGKILNENCFKFLKQF